MEFSRAISYRLNELMTERRITAYKLSFLSAVPTSTVSNILLCKGRSCTAITLLNLCRGFGITLETLFTSHLFELENIVDDG